MIWLKPVESNRQNNCFKNILSPEKKHSVSSSTLTAPCRLSTFPSDFSPHKDFRYSINLLTWVLQNLLITYIFANYNKNCPYSCRSEPVYSPTTVLISLSLGLRSSPHFLVQPQYFWNTVLASINAQLIKLIVVSISFCSLALLEFLFTMPLQVHTHALKLQKSQCFIAVLSPQNQWWPGSVAQSSLQCYMPTKLLIAKKPQTSKRNKQENPNIPTMKRRKTSSRNCEAAKTMEPEAADSKWK